VGIEAEWKIINGDKEIRFWVLVEMQMEHPETVPGFILRNDML
jgi:hypothetical protein